MYAVCSSSAGDDGLAGLLARVQLTATVVMCTPPHYSRCLLGGAPLSLSLSLFLALTAACTVQWISSSVKAGTRKKLG